MPALQSHLPTLPPLPLQSEGSVVALYSPRFGPSKGPGGGSSNSTNNGLAVSQAAQVELLATSAGWGFCRGVTKVRGVVGA